MDNLDKEILRILLFDANISYEQIAKKVHSTRSTVHYRVQNMIDKGEIVRYTVSLNLEKTHGIHKIIIMRCPEKNLSRVTLELERDPCVIRYFLCEGGISCIAEFFSPTEDALEPFLSRIHPYCTSVRVERIKSVQKKDYIPL